MWVDSLVVLEDLADRRLELLGDVKESVSFLDDVLSLLSPSTSGLSSTSFPSKNLLDGSKVLTTAIGLGFLLRCGSWRQFQRVDSLDARIETAGQFGVNLKPEAEIQIQPNSEITSMMNLHWLSRTRLQSATTNPPSRRWRDS